MTESVKEQRRNPITRAWYAIVDRLESREKIDRTRYAFLPAALEIQETPPSPIGRAIIWTIVILFIVAVIWACVGHMDVVATAQGKIIPTGRIKTIQPVELGKVKVLHVKEGQQVSQGDKLVTLDGTSTQADVNRIQRQLLQAKLETGRYKQFQRLIETGVPNQKTGLLIKSNADVISDSNTLSQRQLLNEQIQEYNAKRANLTQQLAKLRAERIRIAATKTKLARTLPLITERVESLEALMHKHMIARDKYLELEQERVEHEQDLAALMAQDQELAAALAASQSQLDTFKAEALKNNLLELNSTQKQITALEQEFIKAEQRHEQQIITAPIDGTVQQLAIHTVGGVVTPAQVLMQIVPSDSRLEVEAMVLNKDIGFVEEGQIAEVKVDTFNFTKYGTIDAQIDNISDDAITHEQMGLVYAAKVLIKKTQMQINERLVNLSPGMAVTVEVKTGKRRIIEYFLSPLLRYKQESIRER